MNDCVSDWKLDGDVIELSSICLSDPIAIVNSYGCKQFIIMNDKSFYLFFSMFRAISFCLQVEFVK